MGVNVLLSLIFQSISLLEKRTIKLMYFEELSKSNSLLIEYYKVVFIRIILPK